LVVVVVLEPILAVVVPNSPLRVPAAAEVEFQPAVAPTTAATGGRRADGRVAPAGYAARRSAVLAFVVPV